MQQVHMCKQVVFQTIRAVWQSSISHTIHCANKMCLDTHGLAETCWYYRIFKREIQMKFKENVLKQLNLMQPKLSQCLV